MGTMGTVVGALIPATIFDSCPDARIEVEDVVVPPPTPAGPRVGPVRVPLVAS